MKTQVLYIIIAVLFVQFGHSQRGVRIGYIDTEYILENIPEYEKAQAQLDQKAQAWKIDIEKNLKGIAQKKESLKNEKILLTQELYDEKFEDISFEEAKIIEYQQNRFGPKGDLVIQKSKLIQPIQDQIFNATQEIVEKKKLDFIFDKSADVVMLYAAERYDISDQVLQIINRTNKRKQVQSKKEKKELENEELISDSDPEKEAKRLQKDKENEDKKTARQQQLEDRNAQRKALQEEKRKKQTAAREQRKLELEERKRKAKERRNNRNSSKKKENNKENDTVEPVKNETDKASESAEVKESNELEKDEAEKEKLTPTQRRQALQEKKKRDLETKRKRAQEIKDKRKKRRDSIINARKNKGGA